MIEPFTIILTASFTLIGGVFLFILNNIFVIPIQELRKLIGVIGYHVFLSRSLVENIRIDDDISKDKLAEFEAATDKLKELSAKLRASVNIIPLYSFFRKIKILPGKKDLLEAAGSLSIISYSKYEHDKEKISKEIDNLFKRLKLDMYGE